MARGFMLDINRFIEKAGKNGRAVAAKIVLDMGTNIVLRTPVGDPLVWKHPAPAGYAGGRARGSWGYGFNSVPAPVDQIDESGQASIGRISAGVAASTPPGVHYIVNTLPYIKRLEFDSWSKQAPEGMVRVTIREFQQFVDAAVRNLP